MCLVGQRDKSNRSTPRRSGSPPGGPENNGRQESFAWIL